MTVEYVNRLGKTHYLYRTIEDRRLFQPARYCFRGRIDGWIDIGSPDRLDRLVATYVRHLDKDSFYNLF